MSTQVSTTSLRDELRALDARKRADKAELARLEAEGMMSMLEYVKVTPEPKATNGFLDFDSFPFQVEMYGEEFTAAREGVILKSTQVGVSALVWRWAMREADQAGRTALYIFPTQDHVNEFAVERVDPSIDASDHLIRAIGNGVRQNRLKQLNGSSFIHFRGSNSRAGAQSIAADSLVFDEYDELDQPNVAQIERRLSGAAAAGRPPRTRRVGVPTIPGFGVHAHYERSDQRKWLVTCEKCKLSQEITWGKNVRWTNPGSDEVMYAGHDIYRDREAVTRAWRACSSCDTRLDVREGAWVKMNPDADVPGYHVTRLIVPYTDLEELVRNSRKTQIHEIEAFHNNDLGVPYSPSEASLGRDTILAACALGLEPVDRYDGTWPVTMGIDVAGERDLNIRITECLPSGINRALWIGTASSFTEAAAKMDRYRVQLCVIDANPERRLARTFAASYPGRVYLCEYGEPEEEPIRLKPDDRMVRVNRTEAIDGMMDTMRDRTNLPLLVPPPLYVEHLMAPKRRTEITPRGKLRRVYVSTGTSGDDYAHAEVYDLVARNLLRMAGIVGRREIENSTPQEPEDLGYEPAGLITDWDEYAPGFGERDEW